MNVFVFDIEAIPDVKAGKAIYGLSNLTDAEVAKAMSAIRREETNGSDFLRLHLYQIVAISAVLRTRDTLKVWSLGEPESTEKELIQRFFAGIDRYTPTLISWNGGGFDLPVLQYRSLLHGIPAPRYWEIGEQDQQFRFNNYLNRYHSRHTDLMDVLSAYQARAAVPLNEIAVLLGLPGKMGVDGSEVWPMYQQGKITEIRNYCETDVLNTYLVFLRYELIRGILSEQQYLGECQLVRDTLIQQNQSHLNEFLQRWKT